MGDGDNLYFSGSNPARFVRFRCRYKPGIMGQSLILSISDLALVGFALADNLCSQVLFQKRALRTDMGPGNESHFFTPTLIGLADFSSATNSKTAHPAQRHQASTITGTTTEMLGCILQLARLASLKGGAFGVLCCTLPLHLVPRLFSICTLPRLFAVLCCLDACWRRLELANARRKQQAVPLQPKPQLAELLFRPVGLSGFYQSASLDGYRSRHRRVQSSDVHDNLQTESPLHWLCCSSESLRGQ